MQTPSTLPDNPYVVLQQEVVSINCGKAHHDILLRNINKIHITKRKVGYWSAVVGQILFLPATSYNLNIETTDKGCLKIKINSIQRFFCIQLVSIIRPRIKATA